MKKYLTIIGVSIFVGLLSSCTKDITVDIPQPDAAIVVEGFIENGVPPYVLLTRNSAFFGGIDLNDLQSYFVNGADVKVWTGSDTVVLEELCVGDLPAEFQQLFAGVLGFSFEEGSEIPNICGYFPADIFNYITTGNAGFVGEFGKSYHLSVETEEKSLKAVTTIPNKLPFDSLTIRPHPDADVDSLVIVDVHISFPDTAGNFVRYFTKRNDEPFYPPLSLSVFNDKLFVGVDISLPLERGQSPEDDFDFDTYGYFWKGDTVTLRWSNIDINHYNFWNTLENDGGDSPFATPIEVNSNIDGGLGIWGGYGTTLGTIIIPE